MREVEHGDVLESRVSLALEQLKALLKEKAAGLLMEECRPIAIQLMLFDDLNDTEFDTICHICRRQAKLLDAEAWILPPSPTLTIVAHARICSTCKQYIQKKGTGV